MPQKKNDFIIYREFTNPYSRIIHFPTGKVWDVANDGLAFGTTWGDTDIQLSFDATIGGLQVVIPANLPHGEYDYVVYDAASPASGDDPQIGKRIHWSGIDLVGLPEPL